MKRIFIFPTIEEAKAFILTQPRDPVFVAGVGAAEIAAATIRAVKARKPQLVVLAGIAGAYDRSLQRGEVVEVVSERIAGIPARYAREYETSGPDLGLPLAAGVTVNRSGDGLRETGRKQEQEFRETGYGIPVPETKSGDAVSAPAGQTLQPAGERADSPEQPSDMQSAIGDTNGTAGPRLAARNRRHGRAKRAARNRKHGGRGLFRRVRSAGRRLLPDSRRVELCRRTLRPMGRRAGRRKPYRNINPNIRKR